MIQSGKSPMLNESLTGNLATAVKRLTSSVKRQMVAGLGDVDIENTSIPVIKLTARDPRIKSDDYYFFLVYKAAATGALLLAVTDETKKKMVIDVGLTKVVNSDGQTFEVNKNAGSLPWTKRINYAFEIYAIKASEAASKAAKQAQRAEAKRGSDLDYNSPNYRHSGRSAEFLNKMNPGTIDGSGYRRESLSDKAERKAMSQNSFDVKKQEKTIISLGDRIIASMIKYLNQFKGNPAKYDKWSGSLNNYDRAMSELSEVAKSLQSIQEKLQKYGSVSEWMKAEPSSFKNITDPADVEKSWNYQFSRRLTVVRDYIDRAAQS